MFGFDGSTKAIVHFLERIKENKEGNKLTHKEVRAYARLMLNLLPSLQVDVEDEEKIQALLASISSAGLPHYDRSFAAEQILKLLEEQEKRKLSCPDGF
ncbi:MULTISPECIES: hypothetical protein [unclassified Nostoc]|uniref:hypothetical protein n=1 Tax=unclassified Nostoc TaxID=2593658 RepID=UPI002AD58250|nr:hypothetical protein [Nostoc sp. DedQUE03]MDZ7974033.1 hypothetical protein [Nostoc sp. DedQUE03]MDZ8048534.1 hypothetical protein [Nostoc sp. DedQUE02]